MIYIAMSRTPSRRIYHKIYLRRSGERDLLHIKRSDEIDLFIWNDLEKWISSSSGSRSVSPARFKCKKSISPDRFICKRSIFFFSNHFKYKKSISPDRFKKGSMKISKRVLSPFWLRSCFLSTHHVSSIHFNTPIFWYLRPWVCEFPEYQNRRVILYYSTNFSHRSDQHNGRRSCKDWSTIKYKRKRRSDFVVTHKGSLCANHT
jgi:hypothetical protein